jgi:exopolysaccharide biosynthesis polyprenyl glycosylphosphotransferase
MSAIPQSSWGYSVGSGLCEAASVAAALDGHAAPGPLLGARGRRAPRLRLVHDEPSAASASTRAGQARHVVKRAFDVVFATLGLLVGLPLLVLLAMAIKLDSRGPALFRQQRVGLGGRRFHVWKFRTMVVDAESLLVDLRGRNEADGPLFKIKNDPRVTRVGRWLRQFSLDELPQLWNVLRGEMSLVGPRPALPAEMERWGPQVYRRIEVKPGITGLWQVNGRADLTFDDYVRLDLHYVANWSIWMDITLLARTVLTVVRRSGAY